MIKVLNVDDTMEMSRVHMEAFSTFFLTSLGPLFVKRFYEAVLVTEKGYGIGFVENGKLGAFAVGAFEKEGFYRNVVKKHAVKLIFAALPAFLKKPNRAFRIMKAFTAQPYNDSNKNGGVLLSICVDTQLKGRGMGKLILSAFEEKMWEGASLLYLTTDAEKNQDVNQFYLSQGYALTTQYYQGNRKMNLYLKLRK